MGKKRRAKQAAEDKAVQRGEAKSQEMVGALEEGQEYGREKFEKLFGVDETQVGEMVGGSLGRLEENMQRYSGAGDAIRQAGNRQAMLARQRSGQLGSQSAGQQQQIATQASTQAAAVRYKEQEAAEKAYRGVASVLASNAMTTEQAFGAQKLASVRPMGQTDMPRPGFFG